MHQMELQRDQCKFWNEHCLLKPQLARLEEKQAAQTLHHDHGSSSLRFFQKGDAIHVWNLRRGVEKLIQAKVLQRLGTHIYTSGSEAAHSACWPHLAMVKKCWDTSSELALTSGWECATSDYGLCYPSCLAHTRGVIITSINTHSQHKLTWETPVPREGSCTTPSTPHNLKTNILNCTVHLNLHSK